MVAALNGLEARNRMLDALPADVDVLVSALADAGGPLDWAATLQRRMSRPLLK